MNNISRCIAIFFTVVFAQSAYSAGGFSNRDKKEMDRALKNQEDGNYFLNQDSCQEFIDFQRKKQGRLLSQQNKVHEARRVSKEMLKRLKEKQSLLHDAVEKEGTVFLENKSNIKEKYASKRNEVNKGYGEIKCSFDDFDSLIGEIMCQMNRVVKRCGEEDHGSFAEGFYMQLSQETDKYYKELIKIKDDAKLHWENFHCNNQEKNNKKIEREMNEEIEMITNDFFQKRKETQKCFAKNDAETKKEEDFIKKLEKKEKRYNDKLDSLREAENTIIRSSSREGRSLRKDIRTRCNSLGVLKKKLEEMRAENVKKENQGVDDGE